MSSHGHLEVSENGNVTIVHFKAQHFLLVDEWIVCDIGRELQELADGRGPTGQGSSKLIVNFVGVEDLSSLMLGQLMKLRVKMAANKGRLVLCGFSAEVREFFDETMLSQLFEITASEADALAALA